MRNKLLNSQRKVFGVLVNTADNPFAPPKSATASISKSININSQYASKIAQDARKTAQDHKDTSKTHQDTSKDAPRPSKDISKAPARNVKDAPRHLKPLQN